MASGNRKSGNAKQSDHIKLFIVNNKWIKHFVLEAKLYNGYRVYLVFALAINYNFSITSQKQDKCQPKWKLYYKCREFEGHRILHS